MENIDLELLKTIGLFFAIGISAGLLYRLFSFYFLVILATLILLGFISSKVNFLAEQYAFLTVFYKELENLFLSASFKDFFRENIPKIFAIVLGVFLTVKKKR